MTTNQVISLTTDFGEADGYVGTMRGVILNICPQAILVNLSHQIPPQDIRAGAFVLYIAAPYFPPDAIHCIVVDPGVGSDRRAVAVRTPQGIFVAPDNGVLSLVLAEQPAEEVVCLTNPVYQLPLVSSTFHGRDIFAPAAAHLACGVPLSEFGPPAAGLVTFPVPRPAFEGDTLVAAHVMHIDRFGNLILDATAADVGGSRPIFNIKAATIEGLQSTFADVDDGQFLAYVGSSRDHIEIAVRNGNAARQLQARVGDAVAVEYQ
ncbi:MAG: S-adenosyl-l-methionine hydroxide adenosyltransferase family protein [Anaerolineae bacterium]